ncbi:MAG: D-hexose-6-phosphate mutarotase [Neptuniibacter sp.]
MTLQSFIEDLESGSYLIEWQGFTLGVEKHQWGELAYSCHGGQVVFFRPKGQEPLLWVSDCLKPFPAPIRGGVPICWPWFADHPTEHSLPFHGTARISRWVLSDKEVSAAHARLILKPVSELRAGLDVHEEVCVDDHSICIRLTTQNRTKETVSLTQALHSYLAVSERERVEIKGLSGCEYIDKNLGGERLKQDGPLNILSATDRIYHTTKETQLVDKGWGRTVEIKQSNSHSTIVWNPGEAASSMVDVGDAQVDSFVCIEAANTEVFDAIILAPEEVCFIETKISISN